MIFQNIFNINTNVKGRKYCDFSWFRVTSLAKHHCDLLLTLLVDENAKLQLEESAQLSSRRPRFLPLG